MHFTADETLWIALFILGNAILFMLILATAMRLFAPKRLLVFSILVYVATSLCVLSTTYAMAGDRFTSRTSFASFGAITILASFGICGLFTFLGPATADRSATAHMLRFMLEHGHASSRQNVLGAFDSDEFVQKRFVECHTADLIRVDGDSIVLTRKGALIALVFLWLTRLTGAEALPGHSHAFSNPT